MYNDKFETQPKKSGKKAVAMLLVMVLLLGAVVGTTLAWLIDKTVPVVNTFTVGDINITLTEEDAPANNEFPVIPGKTVTKKADVTVKAGSEACWLFVKIEEAGDVTENWIDWEVDPEWQPVPDVANVYFIAVDKVTGTEDVVYNVLANDQVIISGDMTKEYVDALNGNMPTLTFTAYAIQSELLKNGAADVTTAAAAWTLLQSKTTTP